MKLTVTSYKNPNRGIRPVEQGSIVTCDAHPSVPYMVVWDQTRKQLVNLETGLFADDAWIDGQQWYVREAELIVK